MNTDRETGTLNGKLPGEMLMKGPTPAFGYHHRAIRSYRCYQAGVVVQPVDYGLHFPQMDLNKVVLR